MLLGRRDWASRTAGDLNPWISIPSCWRGCSSPSPSRSTSSFRASPSGCRPISPRCTCTAWLTGRDRFLRIARFWTKIFAVSFGMGVVSGVVLSYELGTNWSRFSRVAGNIIGPLAGYEVLSAFFLEASFLAILLFGGKRVPRWLHVLSAVIVAVGTAISAFWILSANSWMHTPAGHEMRDGVAYPGRLVGDRVQPELPLSPRPHAQRLLPHRGLRRARGERALSAQGRPRRRRRAPCCAWRSACSSCWRRCRFFLGDQHGLNTLKHQPTQDRRDGGALGRPQARRLPHLRLAGRQGREEPFRDFDPARLVADPHPRMERPVSRA